jgi:Ran GTPase-activating protein (RanGAP) involved in mRNA processing and transport
VKRNLFGTPGRECQDSSSFCSVHQTQPPRVVFLVEMTPNLVMEILMASHYLYIPILVDISCKMIASHIDEVESLEGVPSEVILQIYGYLDPDTLLKIENSDLHQKISANVDVSLIWKKLCEERGWQPNEWHGIPYAWNDSVSESTELQQLCHHENSVRSASFTTQNEDIHDSHTTGNSLGSGPMWKTMFIHREFCRRLHSFTTFDPEALAQILHFQQNCSHLMTQLRLIPTFVQTSMLDPLYWVDKLPNLEELDLTDNKITKAMMIQLIEQMKGGALPKLQKLKLSNASLTEDEISPLFLYLEESVRQTSWPQIAALDLSGNLLHNQSLRFLATKILAHNASLQYISVRDNQFVSTGDHIDLHSVRALETNESDDAVPDVLSSLKSNNTLKLLDLSDNAISFENVSNTNWRDFFQNRSLMYLLLSGTKLGKGQDEHIVAENFDKFMTSLPLSLHHLNLSHNELSGIVLEKIALALEKNHNVVHLDISDNFFGYSSAIYLSHILQTAVGLKSLNISKNYLADAGGREIARTIGYNRNLVKLDLESNRLGNTALEIAKAVVAHQETMNLRYLNLDMNNMSGNVLNQIKNVFQGNNKIKLVLDHW